jgi:hypothetical protein
MTPPQRACQPSAFFVSSQNSQRVSVDGWYTVRCWSDPAAGRASAGSGTAAKSFANAGAFVSSLTATRGWPAGTV